MSRAHLVLTLQAAVAFGCSLASLTVLKAGWPRWAAPFQPVLLLLSAVRGVQVDCRRRSRWLVVTLPLVLATVAPPVAG